MSSIKPRVKVPKEVSVNEVIEIKTLIRHPMHSGRMKDVDGQTIHMVDVVQDYLSRKVQIIG